MSLGINPSFIYDSFVKSPGSPAAPDHFRDICTIIIQIQILKVGMVALQSWADSIVEQARTSKEDYKQKVYNQEQLNSEETLKMRRFEDQHLNPSCYLSSFLSILC